MISKIIFEVIYCEYLYIHSQMKYIFYDVTLTFYFVLILVIIKILLEDIYYFNHNSK